MTDNRTTELRRLLTERGIEYETNDHMGVCETSWNGFTVMQLTPSAKLIMTVTPEQAIAATLGSEREKRLKKLVRIYGEIANYFCERFACCDAEFANCKYCIGLPQGGQCELGWCNDESNALGIEQPNYGGGECEWVIREKWPNRSGDDHVYGYETGCGARHTWWPDSLPKFCPTCGGKVKVVDA